MSKVKNEDMLKSEMLGYINTLIRKGHLQDNEISPDNWDNIKDLVIQSSDDTRYRDFTYDDIYHNPYIIKGGRRKSRKNRRKSKKSRKHRRKSKRHSRR